MSDNSSPVSTDPTPEGPPDPPAPGPQGDALFEVLLRVARDMNSEKDLDRLLAFIPEVVTEMTGAERCTIFILDHQTGELWSRIATGSQQEIRIKVGTGIAGKVAEDGAVLNIADAYRDPRFDPAVDRRTGFRTRNLLAVPLRNLEGRILGVFQLLNKTSGAFSSRDIDFLELFGSHAAVALEGARLNRENRAIISELTQARQDLEVELERVGNLYAIEQEISRNADFGVILGEVIGLATRALQADAGSLLMPRESEDRLYFQFSSGGKADTLESVSISRHEGIAGWVMNFLEPVICNDPVHDPRFHQQFAVEITYQVRNLLAVPLLVDSRPVGVLEVLNKTTGDFSQRDLETLQFIGGQIAGTLSRKHLMEENQKAQRLSTVGDMVGRIIHDFKNPMGTIKGMAQMLAEDLIPQERRGKYGDMMIQAVERCEQMTQEILDFARGDASFHFEELDMGTVMDELLPLMEQDCADNQVTLEIECPRDLTLRVDRLRIGRVLLNLVKNAAEALPAGGRVRVEAHPVTVGIEIRVDDDGPGIPPEVRASLWEPFSTFGKKNGTGLGLAICRSVVEGHMGNIELVEKPEPGARFVVTLPRPDHRVP